MHIRFLCQQVCNRYDIADCYGGVGIGLCYLRLLGEELSRPLTPRRMIAVKLRDARQAQEFVRIVIQSWFERLAIALNRLDIALQLLPAREAIASGEHTLCVMQSESSRVGSLLVSLDFGDGGDVASTVGFEQILRLML